MDLRAYYRRIRETEASLDDEFPVLRSVATEAGGVGGRLAETTREVAARMIVDGAAELATPEEAAELRRRAAEAQRKELERRKASQVQLTVISQEDLQSLTRSGGGRRRE
jgi:hypothetical protein